MDVLVSPLILQGAYVTEVNWVFKWMMTEIKQDESFLST